MKTETNTTLFDTIKNCPADAETVEYVADCMRHAGKRLDDAALNEYRSGLLDALALEER